MEWVIPKDGCGMLSQVAGVLVGVWLASTFTSEVIL